MIRVENVKLRGWVTLLLGSATLTLWVIFRFSTKSVNFDLVGQQLLARQWLEGNFEGAVIGPTNYIVKMLILYMPAEYLGIDPKLFLIFSTIFVNVSTFIGLYFVLKKIMEYFSVDAGSMFHLSMLWLAGVAGSVFWVQFTNSRNLELLAGLTLIYIGLLLYKKASAFFSIIFILLAGITYFSDPLQLFVSSTVLVLYVSLSTFLLEKKKRRELLIILLLIFGGYVFSRLIMLATQRVTGVEFITMDTLSQSFTALNNMPVVVVETLKNMLRLVAGTNEMGVWRQVMNIVLVGFLAGLSIFSIARNKLYVRRQSLLLFAALMITMPIAVYAASGQAVYGGDTSRYLIVLSPALILLFSLIDIKSFLAGRLVVFTLAFLVVINIGSLLQATISSDGEVLSMAHLEPRYAYLEREGYRYGYASMDTAIPSMYFFGRESGRVFLPLSCEGTVLIKSTLFYDKSVFIKSEKEDWVVPIILDGDAISNYPHNCTAELIRAQIGKPLTVDASDGNTVLLYTASQLNMIPFK